MNKQAKPRMGEFKHVISNLKRLIKFSWNTDKLLTFGYYASAGISAVFPIVTSYLYKLLVDHAIKTQGGTVTFPIILVSVLGVYYVVNITQGFVKWGLQSTYFDYLLRYKLQNKINYEFYKKVSGLDIAHLEEPKTEDLIQKAKDTMTWRVPDFLRQFSYAFANIVSYVTAFILILPFGWWLPFALTLTTLPRLILRTRFGRIVWSIYGSETPEARKMWYMGWLLSNKTAIQESRIFQSSKNLLERFKFIQEKLYRENKKPVDDFAKVLVLPDFLEVGVTFIFALWMVPQVVSGELSVGSFTFFISLLSRLVEAAGGFVLDFGEIYADNLYVDHFFEVLNLEKLVREPVKPAYLSPDQVPNIEFKEVSFKYPNSSKYALKNISFTISPKENVALVGPNGAGKTTIVKLLCRFYDVTSGEILINGNNIKNLSLHHWYRQIGTLFQEFIRYDFTVKENIILGNPSIVNEKKMINAARKSGAEDFINDLPKGYNTLLGKQFEGGVELSIGQWQKLAIARAFYEGAPLLILDEPTSAIDAETEYKIFNNLNSFYKNKSLFFISHRFSTVRMADKILVLERGRIKERGNHEELMKIDGTYASLFTLQARAYQTN